MSAGGDLIATVAGAGEGAWFEAHLSDGRTYRVDGVAPHDEISIAPRPDGTGWADVLSVVRPGPARRAPPCPHAGLCGGCHWLQIDEAAQRTLREERLRALLRAEGVALDGVPITHAPAPHPTAYRHRARFQIDVAGEPPRAGMHQLGARTVVDLPSCPLLAPPLAAAYDALRTLALALRPEGLTGAEITALPESDGALVFLNPRDRPPPAWRALAEALLDRHGGLVAGVAVRAAQGAADGAIAGTPLSVGRTPAGHPVAAAIRGFIQSNLAAADLLADEVARLAAAGGGGPVLELFAGSGLLGWRAAAAGLDVVAIERDPLAVRAGRALPPPPRGRFTLLEGEALDAWRRGDAGASETLVADPSRAGLGPLAAEIGARGPARVVLVECSARSLARDLATLLGAGYRAVEVVLVDLFPQTRHTEGVVRLER